MQTRELTVAGWEQVLEVRDGEYHALIAIHSTALGPALGGTRLWRYENQDAALEDVLRLSRGMSYKNAIAELPVGGGKSVILAPVAITDREALLRSHGRAVEALGGRYLTAEDVGTTPADMDVIARETAHVAGTSAASGDPSPHTARGVFRAIQAGVAHRRGSDDLRGMTVAIQGCGNVGAALAAELTAAGAALVVADVVAERAAAVAARHGARVVATDEIYDVESDVFSPNALGATLNSESIPRLRSRMVVGGANNQLATPGDGARLAERGILYVPDFVANAGGVTTGCGEMNGFPPEWAASRVEAIYDRVRFVLARAEAMGVLPHEAAERVAEERIAAG